VATVRTLCRILAVVCAVAGGGALASGCFQPDYRDGNLRCAPSGACPEGYHCALDHTCWRDGRNPPHVVHLGVGAGGGPAAGAVGAHRATFSLGQPTGGSASSLRGGHVLGSGLVRGTSAP
jgi:hypothetical protein